MVNHLNYELLGGLHGMVPEGGGLNLDTYIFCICKYLLKFLF